MKICAYCGRENDDEAVYCRECGTEEFKVTAGELAEKAPASALPQKPPESAAPSLTFRELTAEEMKLDWVTLTACRTTLEADMVASQLRAAGISVFIPDEFLMQAIAWNVNTYGYVRVQVPPKDYEHAKDFLLASPEEAEDAAPNGGPAAPDDSSRFTDEPP